MGDREGEVNELEVEKDNMKDGKFGKVIWFR